MCIVKIYEWRKRLLNVGDTYKMLTEFIQNWQDSDISYWRITNVHDKKFNFIIL